MKNGQTPWPMPFQVFQRDHRESGTIPLPADGTRVRLLKGKKVVIPWQKSSGKLKNVPVGGPYTLEREVPQGAVHRIPSLLVGDLWILAGQSNMDGCGKLRDLEPPSSLVHCFYYNEQWGIARDPICRLIDSIDPVHWPQEISDLEKARQEDHKFREIGASLGVTFGKTLVKAVGVPIGLIVCSHSGTSIEQWDPALKSEGGRSLYGSMLRRVQVCGGRVTGCLWYQGESNALPGVSQTYKEKMRSFIESLRTDLGSPSLPFLQVQISKFYGMPEPFTFDDWNQVQQVQLELAQEMKNVGIVAAIDGVLDDIIHLDTRSLKVVGKRLATLAADMVYNRTTRNGLMPAKIFVDKNDRRIVQISYRNVRGKLSPSREIRGFHVEDAEGKRIAVVESFTTKECVVLRLEREVTSGDRMWYGRGLNPVTNLQDEVFAAPCFGPIGLA